MKIAVLFVEPMLYITDLIDEVYKKTEYEFLYIFCQNHLTGKDSIELPENSVLLSGMISERAKQIKNALSVFAPDFCVINGYNTKEQKTAINYCKKRDIHFAIESDTPLKIPANKIKAILKKIYLNRIFTNKNAYSFSGGTRQKENFTYYGMKEEKCFIMPMSVSLDRIDKALLTFDSKEDIKQELGISGKKTFLFVGRVSPEKNVGLLIDAFAEIKKEKDVALVIVGDGSELQGLKERVQSNGIEDVIFTGYTVFPALIKYYKCADCFVLPSSFEPWGLVVNEAMTCNLPVIVSKAVGCGDDLVKEGENGFVFDTDDKESLIDKMTIFLGAEAEKLSVNARNTVENWNYSKYKDNFVNAVEVICIGQD